MPATRAQLRDQLKRSMRALMLVLVARKRHELAGIVSWHEITERPDTYPPAPHEHEQYMARDHAYTLLAQIERNAREEIAETSARFAEALAHEHQETSARFDSLTWHEITERPDTYPPAPHEHEQYASHEALADYAPLVHTHALADLAGIEHADQLVLLARVLAAGKPGQFLQRTKSGYAWGWPDTIVYQQPVSGGMAHIPAPASALLNAILISADGAPILVDNSGTYLQYE